jgi:prephenate dehydratase
MLDDILKRLKIQIIEYRVSRIEYQVLPATSHETSDERPVTSNPQLVTQNAEPFLYISIQFPCKISLIQITYRYYYPLVPAFRNE